MVGLSKNRFVDITDAEKDQNSCKLCEEVLMNAKVLKCCLQTVCEQCIDQWMTDNTKCRFCDRNLSQFSLSSAPLLVMNRINSFKIKCSFSENGCPYVVSVQEIPDHEIHCRYNPEGVCIDCGSIGIAEHDCLSVLKAKYELSKVIDARAIEKSALMSARDSLLSGEELTVDEKKNISHQLEEKIKEIVRKQLIVTNDGNQEGICRRIWKKLKPLDSEKCWNIRFFMYGIGGRFRANCYENLHIVLSIGSLKVDVFTIN